MKKFYVYAIFSSDSEEVLYVGKGSGVASVWSCA